MGLHHLGTGVPLDQASGPAGTTLSPRAVETNQGNTGNHLSARDLLPILSNPIG